MASTDPPKPAQKVGYGNPPVEHQFKPGQSGNPKGRPKGPGSLLKVISKHAGKKILVLESGVEKKMTKMDVVVSAMFTKAAKGDVAAARLLTTLIAAHAAMANEDEEAGFSQADIDVLQSEAEYQQMLLQLKQKKKGAGNG
jgi:hypothetical protein